MALSEQTRIRIDLDELLLINQRNARPTLQEVIINVQDNTAHLDALAGCQLALIVAEDNDGNIVEKADLNALVQSINNARFSEFYFIKKAITDSGTILDAIGNLNFPVLQSDSITIGFNGGNGLAKLHVFVVAPIVLGDEQGNIIGDGQGGAIAI